MRNGQLQLFMTADAVGGVWTYALDLAGGLGVLGIETNLAVLGPSPTQDQVAAAANVQGLTLLETGLPLDWTAQSPADLEAASEALIALAADFQSDIVHLNSPALAAFRPFGRPVVVACHSCVATWWAAVKGGEMPADLAWRSELVARGYAAANVLVAPTTAFAEETARVYGLPETPRTVHNGRTRRPALGAAISTPSEPYAFTAGRLWDKGKNVVTLDQAASRLPLPLYAAGALEGPVGGTVELHSAHALGLLPAVEVDAWMAGASVFASAPLYEPFGLAVLEAAQAGCPLVLSDIATLRELWDGAAAFAPARDPAALAAAIGDLAADPVLRASMAAAARERAAQYSEEAMAAGMMSIYQEALDAVGASA